ncbi:MAG: TIGR03808 family TAT-translocated repetitive protein [Devosiaceae bacterium]
MAEINTLSRRTFIAGAAIGSSLIFPATAKAETLWADLRGSLDATTLGVRPGALDNQSVALQNAIDRAAADGQALFLPAGDYLVSNIDLPSGLTIIGVPGRTRIRYAGDGHLLFATNVSNLHLEGLVLDGNNRALADYAPGLLHVSSGSSITIEGCSVLGSRKHGVVFDRVAGHFDRCTISGARGAAFLSNEAEGLAIRDNVIADCGDNGILVHRWGEGRDASIITGNRIERIRARSGGTGSFGNAINLFRADDVTISGNTIHDCDFSAVRCNAASNAIITGNQCHLSGEVAIFVEFSSQGAIVANNLVDNAATGISITNFNDGGRLAVVQGNTVRNLTGQSRLQTDEPAYGIGISVEADTSVVGNVIEEAALAGVNAGWGPYLRNVIISQNIIRRSEMGVSVSVVDGVESTVISDNIIDDTPGGAIIGMRWLERATDDLVSGGSVPAALVIEGNRALS